VTAARSTNGWATAGRQAKAIAMVAVIDAGASAKGLDPFVNAADIERVTHEWIDQVWEDIGASARMPSGKLYARKPISDETREAVRDVYRSRALHLADRRAAS
jgi:hypothetical protein